jgi:dTDP-4-amino-4,6-dideoxygalactose transaminase
MMRSIQMVDLKNQYLRLKPEIDLAMAEVVESAGFIIGAAVKRFSDSLSSYLGGAYVVPCANGTDALQIAMMALNLKPGSEVILPAFTYAATAEVIALLHLKPILVDVHPQTFLIDTSKIETAITPQTKAIVPVHLFGQCADMEFIVNIARKHNLVVIEDAAQAIGSEYTFSDGTRKQSGTIGDVGCTSFFPSKNLGCMGDGGAMFTENEELAKRLKMIANHGQSVQYHHDDIGVNSRLDTLQAAVLDIKLKHLDSFAAARNAVADYYDKAGVGFSISHHQQLEALLHEWDQSPANLEAIAQQAKAFISSQTGATQHILDYLKNNPRIRLE